MRDYRILWTAVLTAVLILLVGWARPTTYKRGVPEDKFWVDKLSWGPDYDVAIGGCSHVLFGLSPAEMRQVLPDYRIANFGFHALGYSRDYLVALRRLVDGRSRRKIIILGITSWNFRPENSRTNHFTITRRLRRADKLLLHYLGNQNAFFRPYDTWEIRCWFSGDRSGFYQTFYADGFMAGRLIPEPPPATSDKGVPRHVVDPATMAEVLRFVRVWRSEGIEVYGLRVPTSAHTKHVQDKFGGMDQELYVRQFTAAGGVWLSFPDESYKCYDDSHLTEESARRFSQRVAQELARRKQASDPRQSVLQALDIVYPDWGWQR